MRYFVRRLETAICESDRTAHHYAESPDWCEVTKAEARLIWIARDMETLGTWIEAARDVADPAEHPLVAKARSVGSFH